MPFGKSIGEDISLPLEGHPDLMKLAQTMVLGLNFQVKQTLLNCPSGHRKQKKNPLCVDLLMKGARQP